MAIAIALIITIAVCAIGIVYAENKMSDTFYNVIAAADALYKQNGTLGGVDAIAMAMCAYEMYQYALSLEVFDMKLAIMPDMTKAMLSSYNVMATIPQESYQKWLSGEASDAEFEKELMELIDTIVSNVQEVKEK